MPLSATSVRAERVTSGARKEWGEEGVGRGERREGGKGGTNIKCNKRVFRTFQNLCETPRGSIPDIDIMRSFMSTSYVSLFINFGSHPLNQLGKKGRKEMEEEGRREMGREMGRD